MVTGFDEIQRLSQEGVERMMASFGAFSKGWQTLAVEMTEVSKKAFEANSSYVEQLLAVRTLDKAVEVQTDYARAAYQGLVAETSKVNGLVVDMAKEAVKPFEVLETA